MSNWRQVRLVDLCEAHVDCVNRTAPVVDKPTPFKMIRTTNVRGGFIDTENVKYVTEETYLRWTRRLVPRRGDVVLTREAPLGGVGKVRTDEQIFLGQRLYQFRADPKLADSDFLMYALMGPDLQAQIRSFGSGATVEHMRLPDIEKLELAAPDLDEQRRIAGILAAYDDLIENCERRIRVLDEMARALYREWFVLFHYPGHEKTPLVDAPLGRIPKDWHTPRLGEILQVHRGRSYRSSDLADEGGMPFITLKCIDRDGGFRRAGIKRFVGVIPKSHQVKRGDIVVAVTDMTQERRIVARAAVVPTLGDDFGILSMDLVRLEPLPPYSNAWLYAYLRYSTFADYLKQQANGVNVLHLSPDQIRKHMLAVPDPSVATQFGDRVAPFLEAHDVLENRIENLRVTRDLLLPRLLSGQLPVENAA